jgi:hypothetical protein
VTSLGRAIGMATALLVTVGITRASSVRMSSSPAVALLRVAWTARPERIEDCRPQREEELAKLPAHMRQAVVCTGTTAAYRLEVRREGAVIADQIVRGGGLRHDRPLYVFREMSMPPGDAAIAVRFVRVDAVSEPTASGTAAPADSPREHQSAAMDDERRRREDEERIRRQEEAIPSLLSLDRRFHFMPREVILVTYDAERRELVAVERPR